ncbi:hypothetical protein GCM10010277_72850 [Streptomyces longisporoflavus]|uniref:hypothetical protein n=1 Tax=Streptomyces longisporoflavus TaxID=28044 RepID=UPI00167D6035|nr:hypothetical protein [Streptomyces longisporoflavus]GGV65505.1 hypothetical protein GCM10010277_72850 [Streptomyces longisporoflavus]
MKITHVRSRSAFLNDRLDAHFFTSPGVAASEKISLLEASGKRVVSLESIATVWDPPRFARAYAAPEEDGVPYLRPYDVFDFTPVPKDRLSRERNRDVARLVPAEGTILQTCSGRNLGPVAYADSYISNFALSHDMIRINVDDVQTRFYVLAYLKTPTGQALIRRGKSGSVIDHVTTGDISSVPIAFIEDPWREKVSGLVRDSVKAADLARSSMLSLFSEVDSMFPIAESESSGFKHWTSSSRDLDNRLDAAFHHPSVRKARKAALSDRSVRCGDIARAVLPVRYKRYYVSGANGRPILSGRQLLQLDPINLRRVADRSFKEASVYELEEGMTIFGAVGRSEGRQGSASLVTRGRSGWLASNDVMRIVPRAGVSPGAVWLAIAARQTRIQINALSFGSVIDHLNPWDVEDIRIPRISEDLAKRAEDAWELFTRSRELMDEAVAMVESHLSHGFPDQEIPVQRAG